MGDYIHHAIVVTGVEYSPSFRAREKLDDPDFNDLLDAYDKALEIFPHVSELTPTVVNAYRSFFIPPDGSKDGWAESEEGDRQRDLFFAWVDGVRYEDGSVGFSAVEVVWDQPYDPPRVMRTTDGNA